MGRVPAETTRPIRVLNPTRTRWDSTRCSSLPYGEYYKQHEVSHFPLKKKNKMMCLLILSDESSKDLWEQAQ